MRCDGGAKSWMPSQFLARRQCFVYVFPMNARSLRVALVGLDLSQREFAAILGVAPNTVTSWVNADKMPPIVRIFCRVATDHGLDYAKEALRA